MEQHPVPRQITTFEFKLIGFMTLKQFLYLVIFAPLGFIVWRLFPIPYVNIFLGCITALMGVALAFVPVNDRPLDVWIKNLYRRLISPTQYTYLKHNDPLNFLKNLYFVVDPHKVLAHIESQEKLAAYLKTVREKQAAQAHVPARSTKHIDSLLQKPTPELHPAKDDKSAPAVSQPTTPSDGIPSAMPPIRVTQAPQHPFFLGTVKNNKKIPIAGILVYVKDGAGNPVRLLKSNPHGVFATYNPIQSGQYTVEVKDPRGSYFFDTMKMTIDSSQPKQVEVYSKELL